MRLYRSLMYVGIGGTGVQVGTELERRFRAAICGTDGAAFQRKRPDAKRYELPGSIQTVYFDVNQSELDKVPAQTVPDPRYIPATRSTAQYTALRSRADSYPELARDLRLRAPDEVTGWLPPRHGEPNVTPLWAGAGQFPTVGRAVLFNHLCGGPDSVMGTIKKAVDRLSSNQATTDLFSMAGGAARSGSATADVFVTYSIAGGTGAGLFWDFLHLIADAFADTTIKPRIYPLVVLPSAFPEGLGGGRAARLNAAPAVLDLFRLVDHQNSGQSSSSLDAPGAPVDDERAMRLPHKGRIAMRTGTVQTAILISRPPGCEPEELRRSTATLIQSLVATEVNERGAGDGQQQSFASSFINDAAERQTQASDGIGGQGVSTALATSLTVPTEELADMVARGLLAAGAEQLAVPPGTAEQNRRPIERFFTLTGLHDLLMRPKEDFTEPEPTHSARKVTIALGDRVAAMRSGLARQRSRLERAVPEQVEQMDPDSAAAQLLEDNDPFHVQRIVFGHTALGNEFDRQGVYGVMRLRQAAPPAPTMDGGREAAPTVPALRDRKAGFVSVRWDDPLPTQVRQNQDTWYQWQSRVEWTQPWSKLEPSWRPKMERTKATLSVLTGELTEFARRHREHPDGRTAHLRESRTGRSYLLPADGDLAHFHQEAVQGLIAAKVASGALPPGAHEGDLLHALLSPEGWRRAFEELHVDSSAKAAGRAVDALLRHIRRQVEEFLRSPEAGKGPLLPRLGDLLAEAARGTGRLAERDLHRFQAALQGMRPPSFIPQGRGRLKVLVSYPAPAPEKRIEEYLRDTLVLPADEKATYQFTATSTESISVLQMRTEMGITYVREVREILRTWADAIDRPQPQDFLRWRQRTGYEFGYLATREKHRVTILHRLLCAAWNGRVTVDGDLASPISMTLRMTDEVTMTMALQPLDRASSWGSLLYAYELCSIADDSGLRRDFCAQLMREVPDGIGTQPKPPHEIYWMLRSLAAEQTAAIDGMLDELHPSVRTRALQMRGFWAATLPAALDHEFTQGAAIRPNLRELEKAVEGREW